MKVWHLIIPLLIINACTSSPQKDIEIEEGDLIFQNLDCGALCEAIEEVTFGRDGLKFSHVGMIVNHNNELIVVEALGSHVKLTSLNEFRGRTFHQEYIGRLKPAYKHLIKDAAAFAVNQVGVPYDDYFLYNNGKFYCSELIYDAFKAANNNVPILQLEPMTFKSLQTNEFLPAWVDYYKHLNIPIPQDSLGLNPAGISRSETLDLFPLTK